LERQTPEFEISGRLELFTCIPKNVTAPLFNAVHCAILMSATLAPFETSKPHLVFHARLVNLSFGLTFPKEKRLTIAVSVPALFSKDRDSSTDEKKSSQKSYRYN